MEHQKILNLLNSKFVTRKWSIVNDQSNANYDVRNEAIYNTKFLKSNLCDLNDAYIVNGDITATASPTTQVTFKNCGLLTKCISKVDGTTIDDPEGLILVMCIYNLIEYSSNYSETTGSLWFYPKNEATNFDANISNTNNFKSFEYKAKLLENTVALSLQIKLMEF